MHDASRIEGYIAAVEHVYIWYFVALPSAAYVQVHQGRADGADGNFPIRSIDLHTR